jgi:phage shock protein A
MNDGDRIYMTELLAQLKMVGDQKAEGEAEMDKWVGRMGLAQRAGDNALFEAARERARRCREEVRRLESTIMQLEVERDNLKREVRENRRADPAIARTQALLKSLEGTAMDPKEAMFDRMAKESSAEDALDALKGKMGLD